MAISRKVEGALYQLKVEVLARLAVRVGSRLTASEIAQALVSNKTPEEVARLIIDARRGRFWWFGK